MRSHQVLLNILCVEWKQSSFFVSCLDSLLLTLRSPSQCVSSLPMSPSFDVNLLGCRESKVDDEALSVVFDSLIPNGRDQDLSIPLPVYLGKAVYNDTTGGEKASTSTTFLKAQGRSSLGREA
jgi:hypothetical protein